MITVRSGNDTFTFPDATAEDVSQKAATLTINRDEKPIARFRDWTSWHEDGKGGTSAQ